jgi:hypothetical protein
MIVHEAGWGRMRLRVRTPSATVVRVGAVIGIIGAIIALGHQVYASVKGVQVIPPTATGSAVQSAFMVATLASMLSSSLILIGIALRYFGSLAFMRWLSLQAGNERISRHARTTLIVSYAVIAAIPALWLLMIPLAFLGFGGGGGVSYVWIFGGLMIVIGVMLIVMYVMNVALLARLRGMLWALLPTTPTPLTT